MQPPRGPCDPVRVSLVVDVAEGHVRHNVKTNALCCLCCQERVVRESDISSVVSVQTYMPSQGLRTLRVIMWFFMFVFLFATGVGMAASTTYRSHVATDHTAPVAVARLLESAAAAITTTTTTAPLQQYYNNNYYNNYYDNYYGGVAAAITIPIATTFIPLSVVVIIIAVTAWYFCCLNLQYVTVVLKGAPSWFGNSNTMAVWLPAEKVAQLREAVKTAKAAHYHTRAGADLAAIVPTTEQAMQRAVGALSSLIRYRTVGGVAATTTTITTTGGAAYYPAQQQPLLQPQQPLLQPQQPQQPQQNK